MPCFSQKFDLKSWNRLAANESNKKQKTTRIQEQTNFQKHRHQNHRCEYRILLGWTKGCQSTDFVSCTRPTFSTHKKEETPSCLRWESLYLDTGSTSQLQPPQRPAPAWTRARSRLRFHRSPSCSAGAALPSRTARRVSKRCRGGGRWRRPLTAALDLQSCSSGGWPFREDARSLPWPAATLVTAPNTCKTELERQEEHVSG